MKVRKKGKKFREEMKKQKQEKLVKQSKVIAGSLFSATVIMGVITFLSGQPENIIRLLGVMTIMVNASAFYSMLVIHRVSGKFNKIESGMLITLALIMITIFARIIVRIGG